MATAVARREEDRSLHGAADSERESAGAWATLCGLLADCLGLFRHGPSDARKLWAIYHAGYAFPDWTIDDWEKDALALHMPEARLFHPADTSPGLARRLATEREPVNIGMYRAYDERALQKAFGWPRGRYGQSRPGERMMPNIAVYCRTPVLVASGRKVVHCINVIGYAFDCEVQPDWVHFLVRTPRKRRWRALVEAFAQMWSYVFVCARRLRDVRRVYLPDIGAGAFGAGLARHRVDYQTLKDESLELARRFHDPDHLVHIEPAPRIPDLVSAASKEHLDQSLFVNAWDPWSMVGNGNEQDNSLDGHWGRCSAMALLCWPVTNPSVVEAESMVPVEAPRLDC